MNPSPPDFNGLNLRPSLLTTALRALWRSPRTWGVLAGALPGLAAAGPSGEQVVAGDVAVNRPDARHTVIDQASSKAILNWQQFSIAGDEFVQFNQPGRGAVALNRVVGGDVSNILGSLTANGQVFLVNPRGIYFGPNATVDVGGLVASIMDIRDEDFLAGRYTFSRHDDSPAGAAVVNDGYIRAREGGYVVLAGDYTANAGVVEARLGRVVLASGSRMTLDMEGDGLVSFAVDEAVLGELAGVENSGELLADGGRVVMTAKVADELLGAAVNNTGLVRAHSVAEQGGEIYLTAAGGDVVNGGTLDADAGDGEAGGTVRVLGDRDIHLPAGGTITARGDGDGRGGDVRVVANDHLAFRLDHTIDVGGGAPNRGGFVEVSGHGGLQLAGTLRLGGGRVVIDPEKIIIRGGGGPPAGSYGSVGTSVIFEEYLEDLLAGNDSGSGADIRLVADQGIEMEALADGVLDGTNPSGNFSGGDLTLFIGSADDAGGPNPSFGVFDGGSFFLNSNDSTASIVLNADVRVDGDFVAVTGRDANGNGGLGTISLQNVTAGYGGGGFGREIVLGVVGSSDPKTAAVTAGQLTVDGAEGRVRIRAEDSVSVAGIATQQGSVIVDTGSLGTPGSVSITNGITGRDIALGFDPQSVGNPANARSIAVGGTITAAPSCCSDAMVEIRAQDSIDLADITVTQDVGDGFTTRVRVAGGPAGGLDFFDLTAIVNVGDVTVRSGSEVSGGMADIFISGKGVTTGTLTAEGFGGSPSLGAQIRVTGNEGNVDIAGLEATAHNGYGADITVDAYGTGAHDLVVDGDATATGANADIFIQNFADGDLTVNGTVTATGTSGSADIHVDAYGAGAQDLAINGAVTATGMNADVFIENITDGDLTVNGMVTATATSGDAFIDLFGIIGSGAVAAGNLAASGASVSIDVQGTRGVTVGDASAAASNGAADLFVRSTTDNGGAVETGNLTASAPAAETDATIIVTGYGAVTAGNVTVTAGSDGRATVQTFGNAGVSVGELEVSGGGSAFADVLGNGAVTVSRVGLAGATRNALLSLQGGGSGGGAITVGNVMAAGNSASVSFSRFGSGTGAISVGDVTAEAGGSGDARIWLDGAEGGGDITTGRLTAIAGSASGDTASIFVNGRDITTQDLVMDGAARRLQVFGRDIKVASAGGIDLGSSGTIEASRSLTMVARQGDITNAYGNMIQADAIALAAPNGSILLPKTRIYVGDGIARDLGGNPLLADAELINTLQQNAGQIFEGAEPASESINAFFQAGEELVLGSVPQGDAGDYQLDGGSVTDGLNVADGYLALQLGIGTDIDGDSIPDDDNKAGYAWFEGQVIDLGPVVGEAANIIVQWASPNDLAISGDAAPDAIIQLEQSTTYLTVPDHFSRFAGTTHAPGFAAHPLSAASPAVPGTPGGPYVGNVDITGTVGLGSANFLLLTGGSATGLENIQTTGLVALINVLGTSPPPDDTGELLEAVDSEEGELEDLVEEDMDDPESPDTSPRGDQALARVCQ